MIFLSALLRQSVYDKNNRRVGGIRDICVTLNETFPVVTALVVHPTSGNHDLVLPWYQVVTIEELPIRLSVSSTDIISYTPQANEICLRRDILDKQIVDTQGFRVVKVNDLKLVQIKKTARLLGVDISLSGLLRRLGVQPALTMLSRVASVQLPERTITWNYVEPVQMIRYGTTGQLPAVTANTATATAVGVVPQVQLNVAHNKISELRPADIADILEQLDVEKAGAMLDSLDNETAADALNEVEFPLQSELLGELDPTRASNLLGRLAPDDAADILSELPQTEAERLLELMPSADAQPIRNLLRYEGETAGGIMTTEVLSLKENATVEEALAYLRHNSEHLEMIYYLYVIDEENHLKGVVSLRQLVIAEPTARMGSLMNPDVIKVRVEMDQEEVAHVISKYDLLGVPVVDNEEHLVGLITVDDVIDVIREEQAEDFSELAGADVEESEDEEHFSWRTAFYRTGWLIINVVAGFILALLVGQVFRPILSTQVLASTSGALAGASTHSTFDAMISFMPMVLLASGAAAAQTLGVTSWQLRMKRGRDFWRGVFSEIQLGTVGGILASLLVALLALLLFHSWSLSLALAAGFGLALLIAAGCGLLLPNLLHRLRLRGSLISAPLLDPLIAVVSLSIFFIIVQLLAGRM